MQKIPLSFYILIHPINIYPISFYILYNPFIKICSAFCRSSHKKFMKKGYINIYKGKLNLKKMAYEIKNWKEPDCSLILNPDKISDREPYSQEINKEDGEGGALNADYRTVEAIAMVSSLLRASNFIYGEDFVFKTNSLEGISFDFRDKFTKKTGEAILEKYLK